MLHTTPSGPPGRPANRRWPRRRWLAAVALSVGLGLGATRIVLAQTASVPAEVQVELISKLAAYDRTYPARAGSLLHVLVLVKAGGSRSRPAAEAFKSALGNVSTIGGVPFEARLLTYPGAAALAKVCRDEHVGLIYVTPDLDGEIEALAHALSGIDVLSVGALPEYVPKGVVLGFELVSGKPKIVLNLSQAKLQNVEFSSQVLKLMRVYR